MEAPDADYGTDVDALLGHVNEKTRVIFLANPNNPTGYLYSRKEMEELKNICLKHNLYLFSDEAYREFCYDGEYISAMAVRPIAAAPIACFMPAFPNARCARESGCPNNTANPHAEIMNKPSNAPSIRYSGQF